MARLKERYREQIASALMKEFQYENVMQVPKLVKIVINMGVGQATQNPKLLDGAVEELAAISGQKPIIRRAKKSIAAFKLRAGMAIGAKVTLRGDRMYEFLDRLVNVALPRIRDFQGVSAQGFDGHGNYSLGLKDQTVFPEIDYSQVERVRGMDITFVTTASSDDEARALLRHFGMPFRAA
ncbi:MAG TPA: 50S ribosomal protein L5 [Armatimonadota bacterium]|nr:50S ribosomal protein L5 [Armatimonadota bacterium]HOJ21224.1 50S ribosomal protein L5 [Armatimonadota bacterium]HOM82985.1 50S ribosomal protein L5 [Armatimonadota bacterium]HPO72101.1 50S ribosomal protein L5 [Armatimonadota bacterium]HPT98497.1 50S ribosomal protein L5 [Armatimonadota bacterium]